MTSFTSKRVHIFYKLLHFSSQAGVAGDIFENEAGICNTVA